MSIFFYSGKDKRFTHLTLNPPALFSLHTHSESEHTCSTRRALFPGDILVLYYTITSLVDDVFIILSNQS